MVLNDVKKITLPVGLILLIAFFCLWIGQQYGGVWKVLLADCPQTITTSGVISTGQFYLLKQTHEPLFRSDDGQSFTSKLLLVWNRSADSTLYSFCPDTRLEFDEGRPFTADYFFEYIKKIIATSYPDGSVARKGDCVEIRFSKPRKSFLPFLTDYAKAPTIPLASGNEVGLGPYKPKSGGQGWIELSRKKRSYRGYNSIIAYQYKGPGDPLLEDRTIQDFNKISSVEIPKWAKEDYLGFKDISINSVFLVINLSEKNLRDMIYNCMDVRGLRTAFFPARKDHVDIARVLPVGLPGAKPGLVEQNCTQKRVKHSKKLIYANLDTGDGRELKEFFGEFEVKMGVKIEVQSVRPEDFLASLEKNPKKYDLVIVSADASNIDTDFYLDFFGWLDYPLPEAKILYERMKKEDDPEQKIRLMMRVSEIFSEERVILPLYQSLREYYYPHEIKNLIVGRSFLEYPEIMDFSR